MAVKDKIKKVNYWLTHTDKLAKIVALAPIPKAKVIAGGLYAADKLFELIYKFWKTERVEKKINQIKEKRSPG